MPSTGVFICIVLMQYFYYTSKMVWTIDDNSLYTDTDNDKSASIMMIRHQNKPVTFNDVLIESGFEDTDNTENLGEVKRAPSSFGFMGMRGKKLDQFNNKADGNYKFPLNEFWEQNYYYKKRAPSGFMGMRGKKTVNQYPMWTPYYVDRRLNNNRIEDLNRKRVAMGFIGMRGKKHIPPPLTLRIANRPEKFNRNQLM